MAQDDQRGRQREQPQPPQHDDDRQAQDRLAHPYGVPPSQVPGLQRERVASPDEGHDRGGEGDPVGGGQFRVTVGEKRCQENPPAIAIVPVTSIIARDVAT